MTRIRVTLGRISIIELANSNGGKGVFRGNKKGKRWKVATVSLRSISKIDVDNSIYG
jgi:hypothetical protein